MKIPGLILYIILSLSFFGCRYDKVAVMTEDWDYFCSAENVTSKGDKFIDSLHASISYHGANTQSSECAFSGKYASKLKGKKEFAFTINIPNLQADDFIQATVWRKSSNSKGVIVASKDKFYTASDQVAEVANDGWEKLLLEFFVPPNSVSDMTIYVWNNGADSVYFDDLYIKRKKNKLYASYPLQETFQLFIDEKAIQKINRKRAEAFTKGTLISTDEDYVDAIIFADKDFSQSNIRLKGDWLDHLHGDKLSFRIKMGNQYAWRTMKTFSIQTPEARNFQHEWVLHKMLEQENLLTTRYGFIPVARNNRSIGVFAYEEHFDKQLIESNRRREGPIVKYDESLFWKRLQVNSTTGKQLSAPVYNASFVSSFKENTVLKSQMLKQAFVEASSLLYQLKSRQTMVSDLFDVEKFAGFCAFNLLNKTYHGMAWHNIRFYYNPVLCKLEPISFDGGYHEDAVQDFSVLIGSYENVLKSDQSPESALYNLAMMDSSFVNSYLKFLRRITNPDYLNRFYRSYQDQINHDEQRLSEEFIGYTYSNKHIYDAAEVLRNSIPEIEKKLDNGDLYHHLTKVKYSKRKSLTEFDDELVPLLIHCYGDMNQMEQVVDIQNFYGDTIVVIGASSNKEYGDYFLKHEVKVASTSDVFQMQRLLLPKKFDQILVKIPFYDKIVRLPVKSWSAPKPLSSRQVIESQTVFPNNKYYRVEENTILFNSGKLTVDEHVIIPKGYKVYVNSHTTIDIVDSATFVSYSPVYIEGDVHLPVLIQSSDRSAKGFNVFQAQGRSELRNVKFEGISSLGFEGWYTPSAVCFYESDVDMHNVEFSSNSNCDDALNVVRSDFNVSNCKFVNTFADAFDSDFCTGTVSETLFERAGNDAIDFSGSNVTIKDCKIIYPSDKGVSGGEGSNLYVVNTTIEGANIGVASKDLSTVELKQCEIFNCNYGMSAYVKKPEYGAAKIIANNVLVRKNIVLHLIEEKSELTFNNKYIRGTARKVATRFY